MASPCSSTSNAPLRCKCVETRTTHKGSTFIFKEKEVKIDTYNTNTQCVLSDGKDMYMVSKSGHDTNFDAGLSYVIKNFVLNFRNGRKNLLVGPQTLIFRTAPLDLPEEAETAAREALYPLSQQVTGEEKDLFSRPGFFTLQGKIKTVRRVRMTRSQIPIRDISIMCGQHILDVSLWRDEAVTNHNEGDEVELTHLHTSIQANGRGKFNSSHHTTVKIL